MLDHSSTSAGKLRERRSKLAAFAALGVGEAIQIPLLQRIHRGSENERGRSPCIMVVHLERYSSCLLPLLEVAAVPRFRGHTTTNT